MAVTCLIVSSLTDCAITKRLVGSSLLDYYGRAKWLPVVLLSAKLSCSGASRLDTDVIVLFRWPLACVEPVGTYAPDAVNGIEPRKVFAEVVSLHTILPFRFYPLSL